MFNTFLKALPKVIKSYCEDDKLNPAHKLVLVSTLFLTSPSDAIPFYVNLNTSNVFSIIEHTNSILNDHLASDCWVFVEKN